MATLPTAPASPPGSPAGVLPAAVRTRRPLRDTPVLILLWIGLLRLGYRGEAELMAEALCAAYVREGSREFYEPYTGEGLGAEEFGWSALIAELAEPDPTASASYL